MMAIDATTQRHIESHQIYTRTMGNCPAVNRWRSWCNDKAGHIGPHWSTRLFDNGTSMREIWRPGEIDTCPCPPSL